MAVSKLVSEIIEVIFGVERPSEGTEQSSQVGLHKAAGEPLVADNTMRSIT